MCIEFKWIYACFQQTWVSAIDFAIQAKQLKVGKEVLTILKAGSQTLIANVHWSRQKSYSLQKQIKTKGREAPSFAA